MNINSVGFNSAQQNYGKTVQSKQTQQVGFGMSTATIKKIAHLIDTPSEAEKIVAMIKEFNNRDKKPYVVQFGIRNWEHNQPKGGTHLTGDIYERTGLFKMTETYINSAVAKSAEDEKIYGLENIAKKINLILADASKKIAKHAEKQRARAILKELD